MKKCIIYWSVLFCSFVNLFPLLGLTSHLCENLGSELTYFAWTYFHFLWKLGLGCSLLPDSFTPVCLFIGFSMPQVLVFILNLSSLRPMWAWRSLMRGLLRSVAFLSVVHSLNCKAVASMWQYWERKGVINFICLTFAGNLASRCVWVGEAGDRGAVQALHQRFWNWVPNWKVPQHLWPFRDVEGYEFDSTWLS